MEMYKNLPRALREYDELMVVSTSSQDHQEEARPIREWMGEDS